MNITERVFHIEAEIAAFPDKPTIIIPVGSVKTLIRHHRKFAELQEKMQKYRTEARYYKEAYESAKAENQRLKKKQKVKANV